ncbi:terminase large subunit [Kribbella sp. NPDC051137]|uniref:terminase large subunit domain-containing protein n=1 Tax=Kribbella sp. NPDC051137 TaxID=3155045 RepID=UPI00342FB7A2
MSGQDPTGERALALYSTLVMEDGRTVGEAALDAQIEDAAAVLDLTGPRRHWLGRGRGGSKSTDGSAMALCAMVTQAPVGANLYIGANDRDQAAIIHDAARGWIRRSPHLAGLFDPRADRIELPGKAATLTVLPADGAGSWGLLPWWVFLDELAQAKSTANAREFVEALLTALPKVAQSRLVVMTTAGSPLHWSYPVYQAARGSARWRVSDWTEANGLAPTPWQDPEELEEARRSLPAASFERLFHNVWTSADEAVWSEEAIAELVRPTAEPLPYSRRHAYAVGLDVGLTGDRTAVSVSHLEDHSHRDHATGRDVHDGRAVVVDALRYFEGTRADPVRLATVEEEVVSLARRYGGAPVVYDPYQAVGLSQRIRDRGFRVEPFNFSAASKQRLASTAIGLVRDAAWSLPGDPVLVEELRGLRVAETPSGQFRVDHPAGGHDDGFTACVLGAHHLLEAAPVVLRSSAYSDGRLAGRAIQRDDADDAYWAEGGERAFIRGRLDRLASGGGQDWRARGR